MKLLCLLVLLCLEVPGDSLSIDSHHYAAATKCLRLLCKTSADDSECKMCLREVDVSQQPIEALRLCLEEITSCDKEDTETLEKLRTCMALASSEMGTCFNGKRGENYPFPFLPLE
ncbi:uncharacterized protein LOC119569828 [Penaeus monodon]|uniref:uncharacterized protein LOC119569828 n=1 Tax=Penaeus monodon TaxID=6687 RepID=UPI0018A717A7|nr:uncharacterized protein LOC119569828 [Penaeus monodon]XP_037773760.1 uncharacterized protein LOC119569828 [Penaeus monodon]